MASAAEFQFEDKEWQALLKKLQLKLSDVKNNKEFGGILSSAVYSDIVEHFEKEKGPDGNWDSWSNAYEKHLKRIGRNGNKKLQFSGKLRQSFTPSSYRAVPDGVLFFNKAKTSKGFAYAEHHDEGKSSHQGSPRKFMWLSSLGMKNIVDRVQKWLSE